MSEHDTLVVAFNDTAAEYPADRTIVDLIQAQVTRTPDAVAIRDGALVLTYRDLDARANQIAALLRSLGVGRGSVVTVCMEHSAEVVCAMLGVLQTGAAYAPVDSRTPAGRIALIVGETAAVSGAAQPVLLTQSRLADGLPTDVACVVTIDADFSAVAAQSSARVPSGATPSGLAYVIFTSGSTGTPKGVMIEHRSLVNYIWWADNVYAHHVPLVWPLFSSLAFDLTVTSIYAPLISGGSIVAYREDAGVHGAVVFKVVEDGAADIVKLTPAHLAMIKDRNLAGTKIRALIVGGEDFKTELARDVTLAFGRPVEIFNEYGPTEATVGCMIHRFDAAGDVASSVPIGTPGANAGIYVLDEQLRPVRTGVIGEMYIAGDGLARGYLNRPDLTEQRFIVASDPRVLSAGSREQIRLYKTGDLARWSAAGRLEFLGRADHQVKVGGARIELGEIEARLLAHHDVRECVVVVISATDEQRARETPGETGINRLVAYYVSDVPLTAADLRAHLARDLPEYMVPPYFVQLDALPLTTNGKVDRQRLPAPTAANVQTVRAFVRPNTETEKALAAIWAELLNVDQIGIHDAFFDLGGHSLLAIRVASRIRDIFGVDIPFDVMFSQPTIAKLAAALDDVRTAPGVSRQIVHQSGTGPFPLSFAQEQLWLLTQLAPDSPFYNIVDVVRITGAYQRDAMARTLDEMLRRHDVLRTAFVDTDGRPAQMVVPSLAVSLTEVDLRSHAADEREQEWTRVASAQGRKPFVLSEAPLVRATIVHMTDTDHRLLLVIHHIIADEWSMELIHREVGTLYVAYAHGRVSPLEPLPIQYADFACWQRSWLQGDELQRQMSYWKKELAGAPPVLELPTDKPRPRELSYKGASEFFTVPRDLLDQLKALDQQEQTTLFMNLQASFMALLHRYTGQNDILVGTPISGRTQSDTERLIGYFLNTVVLRAQFGDGITFRSLLHQVRERALRAYAHPDLPFDRLVAEMSLERDRGRSPLFQVMFVFHDPDGVSEVSKASGNWELGTGTAKFDLALIVSETTNGLECVVEYSTDLFEAATIQRMCGHYRTLLQAIARTPDRSLAILPLLTDAERTQQLVDWNATSATYPLDRCVHQYFEDTVARRPDAVAVTFEGRDLTYRALNARANQLARHLMQSGVGAGSLVGICVERSPEMIVGILGILKAGGAYVPMDPDYPITRIEHMLSDSRVPLLLTQERLRAQLPSSAAQLLILDDGAPVWSSLPDTNPDCAVSPDDPAYVIYTSGSTGKPKGVVIRHYGVSNLTNYLVGLFALDTESRVLQFAAFGFDASVTEIFPTFLAGATLCLARKEVLASAEDLGALLRDQKISVVTLPPSLLAVLPADGLPALRTLISAGEQCSWGIANQWAAGRRLLNGYGPTETTVAASYYVVPKARDPKAASVPIGRPVANAQVYVLDKQLQLVPVGLPGELHVGGAGVAVGYLHRADLTAEKFIRNPFGDATASRLYKTGDQVRYLADGNLEFLGRIDQQVKVRGFRIELGEIETVLRQHESLKDAAVIARTDKAGNKRLVAYMVNRASAGVSANDLRAFLRTKLPDYMIPANFVPLDTFPLTPNGKVDRQALPDPDHSGAALEEEYVAPRTPVEKTLADIWAQVLQRPRVGIHDNFFGLGGDSILSFQVIARAKRAGVQLSPRHMFQFQTVAELAAAADPLVGGGDPNAGAPVSVVDTGKNKESADLRDALKLLGLN